MTEKQQKDTGTNTNLPIILAEASIDSLPPSVNAIWRSSYKGHRVFKTQAAKEWQENAINILKANKNISTPYDGKVAFMIEIHTKNKRRMDIDNRVKSVQDCLAPAGIIDDDCQIWHLRVSRYMSTVTDKVVLSVRRLMAEVIKNEKDK